MAISDVLRVPTFYEAFNAAKERNAGQSLNNLKQAGVMQQIYDQVQARQREQEMREALASTNGDVEKAIPALLRLGNVGDASKLSQIFEEQRKRSAPLIGSPGTQFLDRDFNVKHTVPTAPPRPQAEPEFMRLLAIRENLRGRLPEGHPMLADLEARIKNMGGEGSGARSPFGNSTTGNALDIMNRLARGYAAGVTTDTEDRQFETAVTHYTQPRQFTDPETGLVQTKRPELPRFVQEAVNARRGARPNAEPPAPSPGAAPQPAPTPAPRSQSEQLPRSVWEMAGDVTGPVPAAAEAASRAPFLGAFVQAPQITAARATVEQVNRDLIRALQNNPRFSEGERKAIEAEISIDPRLWDNPTAYRNRLVGIADALMQRERNLSETANSARVSITERRHAMDASNAIRQHLLSLGVPPRVRNEAEYNALPPGSRYIAPDGEVRRKR